MSQPPKPKLSVSVVVIGIAASAIIFWIPLYFVLRYFGVL